MSNDQTQNNQAQNEQAENDDTQSNQIASETAGSAQTPLEAVQQLKEQQQATLAGARGVDANPDATAEVPGQGPPSSRRHHPQRQMYGSGTNES